MAVTYVSDVDKQDVASGATDTYTSFAVSGSNPVIIFLAAMGNTTVSSIVLSAGLTSGTPVQICTVTGAASNKMEIWAIPAPSGTGTITVTYSASGPHQSCAVLLNGADQTTPCPTGDAKTTSGSTSPLTISPTNLTANDMVVYGGTQVNTGDAPHIQTGTEIFFGNNTATNASFGYNSGTGSVSVSWATTSANEIVAGVRVVAVAGAAQDTPELYGRPEGLRGARILTQLLAT